ncbi:hypothetical protein N7468_001732 [Penicillium chermesinum]|uniref:Xylanolytic transcriptional activator regulatory domain-containing protein n=1 Tax=Penicillium chermesinum TaxID=63820 RepID=A0A9W9PHB5_9EURO|nr:uncharacterized protein N7468_001732 [Penicillium chermesinum]KAJ5246749.1 hypothetical protein N7468_001732 [Penicillium chermesinum]
MFLHEINRAFEMVDPLAFQSRYMAWWITQEKKEVQGDMKVSDEDLDFGLLMIRVSLLSIQCLPHARYPTAGVFSAPIATIEQWLCSTADEIEKTTSSKKPTLTTVQHRFYHVLYLKNYARVRECWATLSATVKDAHEIGLHLKDPGFPLTDLEKEFRRRAFWNLYVWDRFHSAFFGHWPLIPEGYFDIELPIDNMQPLQVTPYMLTPFTDRIFHIKLARFLTAFMSPPSWKQDQVTPTIIEDFAERFKQLPPPFWLDNPDTSWDAVEPTFPSKREMLHMFLLGTQASLYRAFSDPCDSLHQNKHAHHNYRTDMLALRHRRKLMEINCKIIPSIARLYMLSGDEDGGMPERLFLFPTSLVEALAALGVCLLSVQADERNLLLDGIRIEPDEELRHSYAIFFDGFNLLCRQGQKHSIAKRGVKILESLHGTLRASLRSPDLLNTENGGAIPEINGASHPSYAGGYQLEHALVSFHRQRGERAQLAPSVTLPEWLPSFMESPGRSWLFHDMSAYGDLLA